MALKVSSQKYDKSLLVIVFLLMTIGTIMIFSSSTNVSMERYGNGTFYLNRHLFRILIGLVVMFGAMMMDFRIWKKLAPTLLVTSIILLIMTKILFLAEGNRSAARWLQLGPITFQTSDLARFSIIIYLAGYIDKKRDRIKDFINGFLPPIVMTSLVMALVIIQPDFSTAGMIGIITIILLFIGGARWTHLIAIGSVSIAVLIPILMTAEYRMERLKAFFNGGSGVFGMNYQVQQSLFSLGNGGITGVGLGESIGKNLFLPTPHTDFILSIIGEEFGFIGVFITLTLFLALFQRVVKILKGCTDVFGVLLGIGLSIKIILYVFINSAVVTGLIPTTGLPIPFISFGGSSLVINLLSIGILLNISMAKRTVPFKQSRRILYG